MTMTNAWRTMRGTPLVALAAVLLAGCSDEPAPKPYRGEFMATLGLSPDLEQAFVEKYGYDASKNCIQLVGRDTTKDGIRHVNPVVIFSPDPCPEKAGEVAEREAFALDATREPLVPSGMGGGFYPALAYSLVLNAPGVQEVVGNVLLVAEVAPPPPSEPTPGESVENAPKLPVYQLGDVCTLALEHEEMCGLIFTHDGRFNQIDSNRAAVGKRKRERRMVDGLKRHMDQMRNVLSTQLNDVQRNFITVVSQRLDVLQVAVRNEQRMLAMQIVGSLETTIEELATELQANQNVMANNVVEELRREVRALHAENVRILRAEVKAAVAETKATLLDIHTQLAGQLSTVEAGILDRITKSTSKVEANLKAHQRRVALTTYLALSADLDRLETSLANKIDAAKRQQLRAFRRLTQKHTEEVLKAIREEVVQPATALEAEVRARFGQILDKDGLKEQLLAKLREIAESQRASASVLAEELPAVKALIERLARETNVNVEGAMQRMIARIEAALDEETEVSELVTRNALGGQLAAVKRVFAEQKVADKDAENARAFDAILAELEGGGTAAAQLARTETLRSLVVTLARQAGELDEAQSAAIHHLRITLRDYGFVALRIEHRALVRELLAFGADAKRSPRVADRLKRDVPTFAAAKFEERAEGALRIAEGIASEPGAEALVGRLEAFGRAVETEKRLRSRDRELR
jgi:hypothetical protein